MYFAIWRLVGSNPAKFPEHRTGEVCLLHMVGREIIDNGQFSTLVIRKPSRQRAQDSPSSALPNSLPLPLEFPKPIQNP
jgi:hypothetical protein